MKAQRAPGWMKELRAERAACLLTEREMHEGRTSWRYFVSSLPRWRLG